MPTGFYRIDIGKKTGYIELDGYQWRARRPFLPMFGRRCLGRIKTVQKVNVNQYRVNAARAQMHPAVIDSKAMQIERNNRYDYILEDQSEKPFFRFALPESGKSAEGELFTLGADYAKITSQAYPFAPNKTWFGFGLKGGFTIAIYGKEAMVGVVVNLGSFEVVPILVSADRWGVGLGYSGGLTAVIVTGATRGDQLLNISAGGPASGGWDFTVAFGPNFTKCLSAVKKSRLLGEVPGLWSALEKAGGAGSIIGAIKGVLMKYAATTQGRADLANWAKNFSGLSAYNPDEGNVINFDLPISGGEELSLVMVTGSIVATSEGVIEAKSSARAPRDYPADPRRPLY